jgi:hypothetical protein
MTTRLQLVPRSRMSGSTPPLPQYAFKAWCSVKLNYVFGLVKVDLWNPISTSAIQSRSRPMRFLGLSNHEKWAPRKEISKWSTVCSKFSRSGWSVVRSAPLAKEGTSKKRPSPHLHKVPTRSNKVSPRTLQTALVFIRYRLVTITIIISSSSSIINQAQLSLIPCP